MFGAKSRISFLIPAVALALFASACDDGLSVADDGDMPAAAEAATLRVLLTDAPIDYIGAAEVDIGAVELLPAGDGPPILLTEDGTDGYVNLLDFQGAATMQLAEAEIEAGEYAQLRLIVDSARVELADGYYFRDGTTEKNLKVPSGAQTGIKLNLSPADGDGPLGIVPGEMVLVLDFDVNQSFVIRGNFATPAGAHGIIFKPTIRVSVEDVAASISGTVSTELDGVSVEGLTVRAEPTNGGTVEGYQTETGTALTDENGDYTIFFLVPGTYEVSVDLDDGGLGTDPVSREVVLGDGENATDADFEIIDVSGSIAGTVTTEIDGESTDGLTVTATPADDELDPLETTTGEGGVYAFEGVLPGTYTVTVTVGDDRLTDPASQEVEVGPGEDVTEVDFAVIEDVSGSITGTVSTDLEGFDVVGLTVIADPDADGADPVETTTGDGGVYTFESLAPDTYTISVDAGDGFTTDPATETVELEEDEEETEVDFEVIVDSSS